MATTQTGKQYIYTDTAAAILTGNQRLLGWHWSNDTASGKDIAAADVFLLSDASGNRISGKKAIVAGDDLLVILPQAIPVDGLTITTMDGGVFYAWIE